MKRFWLFLILGLIGWSRPVMAADLDRAMVRLDRMETGVNPLPVLILVKTDSLTAAENGFRLTVGTAWTPTGVISTAVSGLPDGVIAWPGLSGGSVNGQNIDFISGDLVSGTTYGFYITGGLSNNGASGDGAANKWRLATLIDGVVDSDREVKVPIIASDSLTVTGRVGANPADFNVEISSNSQGRELNQNEEVVYQISYGSLLKQTVKPLVITGQWSRGEVDSQPGLVVDVVDYVIGSGTTTWGGVAPVVDLINRRITWTISSFPAETVDQGVSFSLKTNGDYTGLAKVTYSVSGQLDAANVVTVGGGQVNESYRFYQQITPSPTPTMIASPTPTITETSGTATTVTNTPIPTSPVPLASYPIESIKVVNLESNVVGLEVLVKRRLSDFRISWGTVWGRPTKTVGILGSGLRYRVNIDGLAPEVRYYFYFSWTENGVERKSEWLTVTTPQRTLEKVVFNKDSLRVVSGDRILWDGFRREDDRTIVIPVTQPYTIKLLLERSDLVRQAQLWIRDKSVMGIVSTYSYSVNELVNDLYSLGRGVYAADFVSPKKSGWYELYQRVYDSFGAIYEQKIGDISVVHPMRITRNDGLGIERAKVLLEYQDTNSKIYKTLPGNSRFPNPMFSEVGGVVDIVLAEGKYRLKASAVGYKDSEIDFEINRTIDKYPEVRMTKNSWNLLDYGRYYGLAMADVFNYSVKSFGELALSYRFFQVICLVVLGLIVFSTWWLFSLKIKVPWWSLVPYFIYRIAHKYFKGLIINGMVVDSDGGFPIIRAEVYVIDDKTNKILKKISTDVFGRFYLRLETKVKKYKFMIMARGFETSPFMEYETDSIITGNLRWQLKRMDKNNMLAVERVLELLASRLFDLLLTFSIISEIFLLGVYGLAVVPLILLSSLNLLMVIDYWRILGRKR